MATSSHMNRWQAKFAERHEEFAEPHKKSLLIHLGSNKEGSIQ
jgi:hypothetical protein